MAGAKKQYKHCMNAFGIKERTKEGKKEGKGKEGKGGRKEGKKER